MSICCKVHLSAPGQFRPCQLLEERAEGSEPQYERGATMVTLAGRPTEVAWAFPIE
jgi:hypothetical protein